MEKYIRKVCYHETDKMGITHHSNYIKWMEEARIFFLDRVGYGYARLEAEGVVSPVISVECSYKTPTTFDDVVEINVNVAEYRGVKLVFSYEMINSKTGQTVCTARSEHCFLGANGRPITLKKQFPDLDEKLKELTK